MEQKNNSGTIFRNAKKETAQAPDYSGTATVGEKKYRIAGWINKSKTGSNYLRILFSEQQAQDLNESASQAQMPIQPQSSQVNPNLLKSNGTFTDPVELLGWDG